MAQGMLAQDGQRGGDSGQDQMTHLQVVRKQVDVEPYSVADEAAEDSSAGRVVSLRGTRVYC